jgi:glycosyltransferase involved in cell wall biosynthesis
MNDHFEVIGVTTKDHKHFQEIQEREKIKMCAIRMNRTITPIADVIALFRLYVLFLREKPTIVHTHTPKAGFLGIIAAWLARVPIRLHTVAGLPLLETAGMRKIILSAIERLTYRQATRIYSNSPKLADILVKKRLVRRSKISTIGNGSSNGIDMRYFSRESVPNVNSLKDEVRRSNGFDDQDFIFCFVGRIAFEKGVSELVASFEKLVRVFATKGLEKRPKLLFVGTFERENGSITNELETLIKTHPLVKYVGRHDDIRPFLIASDVLVLPSYREGFPGVVMQAGAMGLPCIVSDINGCNEIITPNENGLLVIPKDVNSLFRAMRDIIVNNSLYDQLAFNARRMIEGKYDQKLIWSQLLNEYRDLMSSYNLRYSVKK